MSTPESPYAHAEPVLRQIATDFNFDTFVYLADLQRVSQEEDIPATEWRDILAAWDYNPETFLELHGRGNCIDFACYGQRALGEVGIETDTIGEISRLGHVTLAAELDGPTPGFTLFETSWKAPEPIPLLPVGVAQESGGGVFTTVSYDDTKMVQGIVTPRGNTTERTLSMHPITNAEMTYITRLRRQYRAGLHMFTPLGKDVPDYYIRYNAKKEALTSNVESLPKYFLEDDITDTINQEISGAFGFNVKEELVAALGLRRAFPQEYWLNPEDQKPGLLAIGL